jgi:hypothetical protein
VPEGGERGTEGDAVRIRQIKPGWWLDKELRRGLSADAREFYIGLWCVSDDSGWLAWDVEVIGAELYPYGTGGGGLFDGDLIEQREACVRTWARQLQELDPKRPHLVIEKCGKHARLTRLTEHQRFGGRPVYTVREAHARDCARTRANAPGGKVIGTVGNGSDGSQATNETTGGLVDRLGSFDQILGGKAS